MGAKLTLQSYQKRLADKLGKHIIALHYDGYTKVCLHNCSKHNVRFKAKPSNLLNNSNRNGCQQCKSDNLTVAGTKRLKSSAAYRSLCKSKNLKPLTRYSGAFVKIDHECLTCGFVWNTMPDTVRQSSGKCPNCLYPNKYKSLNDWKQTLKGKNMVPLQDTGKYLKIQYTDCGHIADKFKKTIFVNPGCLACLRSKGRPTISYKTFIRRLGTRHKNLRILTDEYGFSGVCKKYKFFCKTHKVTFEDTGSKYSSYYKYAVGCPKCNKVNKEVRYKGKRLFIRGYEGLALKWLKKNKPDVYSSLSVVGDRMQCPVFNYTCRGKVHTYYPDFYCTTGVVIEVKSVYTLTRNEDVFRKNVAKSNAVKSCGYKHKVLVFDHNGNRVRLPTDWKSYNYMDLRTRLNRK